MSLRPGARIGPYEVVSPLGAGGMGEVYRARDARLDRDVALKILPAAFAADPDRLARFEREAKLLAALNHPNIAGIHGVEQSDGVRALVLELVEGETLADVVARGAIPLADALAIARQIADALEAAHGQGIVHRDLKPANVKITPAGTVKVLDFGLAKLSDAAASGASNVLSLSPTITSPAMMTGVGVLLGTAAYMPPEQARGKPADRRADVWAFGCVLFEVLTGRRAFDGEDITVVIGAVIHKEPEWSALPADTPDHVRAALQACLRKDPRQRLHAVGDAQLMLDRALGAAPAGAPDLRAGRVQRRTWTALVGGVGAGAVVALAASVAIFNWQSREPQQVRFAIVPPPAQPLALNTNDRNIALSADGTLLVYRSVIGQGALAQMFVRSLDQLEARPLAGISNPRQPFLSPDGRWVGFFAGDGTLKKVSITGGPPITLCRVAGTLRGASWGTDGTIVFATDDRNSGLWRVAAEGGEPEMLTKPDRAKGEDDHWFPVALPNGRGVLYVVPVPGQFEDGQVAVFDPQSGQQRILIRGASFAEYVDGGYIVYAAGTAMRAVRFDLDRLEVTSDPVPVLEQVALGANTAAANFIVARNGTLAYVPGDAALTEVRRQIVWVTRRGEEQPTTVPPRAYQYVRLSPDGSRLVLDSRDQDNDLWIWDLRRQALTRLTFDSGLDRSPIWAADGKRVFYTSQEGGPDRLFWRAADGTGTPQRLTDGTAGVPFATGLTADGTRLLFREAGPKTDTDVWLLALDGGSKAAPILQTTFDDLNGDVSPNMRWIAYESNKSGQDEIYVRPFPDVNAGEWQISTGGGTRPAWSRSGRELFYLNAKAAMTAVPVNADGAAFVAGNPVQLFDTAYATPQPGRTYDVALDDQRFLMIKDMRFDATSTATPASIIVVLNWRQELERLVPAD